MTSFTHYILDGTKVVAQYQTSTSSITPSNVIYFYYDESGSPTGIKYNGNVYFFQKNLQGDIIRILNTSGTIVATYTYDAWGNIIASTDTSGVSIGTKNPFRYRGYYYDTETGLYYLNSRYYDPQVGRFLNADGFVSTGQGLLGSNMFAYCGNNPVIRVDYCGNCWIFLPCGGCEYRPCDLPIPDDIVGEFQECLVSSEAMKQIGFKDTSMKSHGELNDTLVEHNINTIEEISHFLSQCAYESNYGKWLLELGKGKNKKYYPYYGAGYIQLTWEENYIAFSNYIGDSSIYTEGPSYVAEYYPWSAAGWWWSDNNMNERISKGATVFDVTKRVRGNEKTWEERNEIYNKIYDILKAGGRY